MHTCNQIYTNNITTLTEHPKVNKVFLPPTCQSPTKKQIGAETVDGQTTAAMC